MADVPTAHIVVDDAHLDTCASPVDQGIGDKAAQGVFLDDIHINMYMIAGARDVGQQSREELVAIGKDFGRPHLEGQRETLIDEQIDDGLVLLG